MWMRPSYALLISFPNLRLTSIRQLREEWRAQNSSSHWHSCCNLSYLSGKHQTSVLSRADIKMESRGNDVTVGIEVQFAIFKGIFSPKHIICF